jgi:glycyl-tRNA synthetase
VKIAVLPLLKKRSEIVATCHDLRPAGQALDHALRRHGGDQRLYRRQDEVGTPYCVTVDVKTVGDAEKGEAGDQRVTIRERDSMEQIRVPLPELESVFAKLLGGETAWRDVAAAYPRAEG